MVAITKSRTQDNLGSGAPSNSLLRLSRTPELINQVPITLDLLSASSDEVANALRVDNFTRYPAIQENANYFSLADYVIVNPRGISTPELDLIRSLDLEILEELRKTGLLLYNSNTGEYYLMNKYDGLQIDPSGLIGLIQQVVTALKSSIQVARRTNGLQRGVEEGEIRDINSYLAAHGFTKGNPNKLFLKRIESIFNYNIQLLEQANGAVAQAEAEENEVTIDDIESMFIHVRQFRVNATEIGNQVLQFFPDNATRNQLYEDLLERLPDSERFLLLETMEYTGDFVWSRVPIDTKDKIEAIIPVELSTDEINLGQVLEKQVANPIINFLNSHPSWLRHYQLVANFVSRKLKLQMDAYQIANSQESAEKIEASILKHLTAAFKIEIARLSTEG